MKERISKKIAAAGIASRRKAEELIRAGKVSVNGHIAELGEQADDDDVITVNGRPISFEEKVYYLLNKPAKVLCTVSDDRGRKTILSYLPDGKRIFPVGRLDFDTTGFLLVTNDGAFSNLLIHPRHHLPKTYLCRVGGQFTKKQIRQLEHGILLEDGMTLPAEAEIVSYTEHPKETLISITLQEGRNREIRRMMNYFHHPVLSLQRISMGSLTLGELKEGEYRPLQKHEIELLKQEAMAQSVSIPAASRSSREGSM